MWIIAFSVLPFLFSSFASSPGELSLFSDSPKWRAFDDVKRQVIARREGEAALTPPGPTERVQREDLDRLEEFMEADTGDFMDTILDDFDIHYTHRLLTAYALRLEVGIVNRQIGVLTHALLKIDTENLPSIEEAIRELRLIIETQNSIPGFALLDYPQLEARLGDVQAAMHAEAKHAVVDALHLRNLGDVYEEPLLQVILAPAMSIVDSALTRDPALRLATLEQTQEEILSIRTDTAIFFEFFAEDVPHTLSWGIFRPRLTHPCLWP